MKGKKKQHVLAPPTDTQETPGGRCLIFDPGICSSEVRMPSGLSRSVVRVHGLAVTAHMTKVYVNRSVRSLIFTCRRWYDVIILYLT